MLGYLYRSQIYWHWKMSVNIHYICEIFKKCYLLHHSNYISQSRSHPCYHFQVQKFGLKQVWKNCLLNNFSKAHPVVSRWIVQTMLSETFPPTQIPLWFFFPFYGMMTFSGSFHRLLHTDNPRYKVDCPRSSIAAICLRYRKHFPKTRCC